MIRNGYTIKPYANLRSANLRSANLYGADLYGANLYGANLSGADLYGANLRGANLSCADLRSTDLSGANLRSADLSGADLSGANLSGADLSCADLYGANLSGAKGIKLAIARTRILPDGDIIGWKKCQDEVIVKLLIPKDSPRSHAFGRKCRAAFVDVLEVHGAWKGISLHDRMTRYVVGERVGCAEPFDPNWMEECASGIHFYITREEAEAHI